jgi:signal transduction histidine kinase
MPEAPILPATRAPAAPRPVSLQWRLLLLAALTIVAALAIALFALTAAFDHYLERRVEQELEVKLHELAAAFGLDEQGDPALLRPLSDPRYGQPYSGAYWQVATAAGPLLRGRSLWDRSLPHDDPRGRAPAAYETQGPDGATLYVLERDVRLAAGGTPRSFRLTVAIDHKELEELAAEFRHDAAIALGVIAAVLVLGAWLQLSLGLRPLRALQAQVSRIREGRAARLEGAFPAEVAPLAGSLNELIDAQEDTVRRARARAGDLAHGLKTPLAILAAEARRLDEAGQPASATRLREQIDAMRAHVERQLARARSHGAAAAGGQATDAHPSLERLFALLRRLPRGDALAWENAVPPGLRLRMDPEDFGEVMGNLLDNARLWARSRVAVSARLDGRQIRIAVEDDGPGIPPAQRDRLRARGESDPAPTRRPTDAPTLASDQGSGLGLAIVADVLALYGTGIAIADAPAGGCRIEFAVPGWQERPPR